MNDLSSGGINLDTALNILKRRLWIAITLFSVVLTVTICLVKFLPNVYTAGAFILIEGQQIPSQYVQSTVTSGITSRLHTISQQILSRSRLNNLIKQFNLYEGLRKRVPSDEVIERMRQDISIEIKNTSSGKRRGAHNTVGFEVSYTGSNPRKVMMVANTLTSFYIEENLKMRARQATGTSDFLTSELQEIKKMLEKQEQRIAISKKKYLGELPGQLEANLKTLERLQAQMQLVSNNLIRAQERRDTLVRHISQINGNIPSSLEGDPTPDSLATRIDNLNDELAVLKSRFSDKHPDVIRLKHVITSLEVPLKNGNEEAEPQPDSSSPTARPNPVKTRLQDSMIELDTEIKLRKAELEKTRDAIVIYQRRIENTPAREQELRVITRDYESTRQHYHSLLKRQEEAKLASSMEQRQKSERFQIIDPAIIPESSVAPNRVRLFLVGFFLSFVMAGAGVFVREKTDTSFHRVEDLQAFTKTPILVSIPRIITKADQWSRRRRQRLGVAALALLLVAVVGGSYLLAAGNEELVKRFSKPASGLQLR